MTIRAGELSDATGLAAAHVASWEEAYREILPADAIEEWNQKRPAQWDAYLRDPTNPAKNLVCEVDGEIAGFTRYGHCRDDGIDPKVNGELHAIYVTPRFWGRGCGYALWQATLERLRDAGYADVAVWTLQQNVRARCFYERIGFALQPGRVKFFERNGERFPEVRYWQAIELA